jgi:hypothetical protein
MSLRFLPNLLCVLRMLLVYPVARAILDAQFERVLVLFAIAAFTDALDVSHSAWPRQQLAISIRRRQRC